MKRIGNTKLVYQRLFACNVEELMQVSFVSSGLFNKAVNREKNIKHISVTNNTIVLII